MIANDNIITIEQKFIKGLFNLSSGMTLEEIAEKTGLDYELLVGLRMGYMEFENLRISQVMKLIELGEKRVHKGRL